MNPRDIIAEALRSIPPLGVAANGWEDDADAALVALAERGFVVVACPPGERRVVDRTQTRTCETCGGEGGWEGNDGGGPDFECPPCGGSGVVEATTTYGLVVEEELLTVPNICNHMSSTFCPRTDHEREPWSYRLAAVALPEETPQ